MKPGPVPSTSSRSPSVAAQVEPAHRSRPGTQGFVSSSQARILYFMAMARLSRLIFTQIIIVMLCHEVWSQQATPVQSAQLPFVGGGYRVTMSYDEVRGDVGQDNACTGTFPYQITWDVDIYQLAGSPAIRFCISGTDCSEKYWDSTLVQATPLARQVNFLFLRVNCLDNRSVGRQHAPSLRIHQCLELI